tara:strand:+ start:8769 stop:9644 length:876 start_codon:yes stop_codon:yes gene_type:complete
MFVYITGTKFSELADFSVADIETTNKNKDDLSKYKIARGAKKTKEIINQIQLSKIFFIQPNSLADFAYSVLPHIINNFILITHNSSYTVGLMDTQIDSIKEIRVASNKIINNKNLLRWFGLNMIPGDKCEGILDGLPNPHLLPEIKYKFLEDNKLNLKTNLIYINFSTKTHNCRHQILKILKKNKLKINNGNPWDKFIKELSTHKFCACPRGNGVDTHRMYEALCLNVIPVVEKNIIIYNYFNDLPILWIDNWDIITPEYLNIKYEEIKSKSYNLDKLNFSYWKEKILNML